MREGRQEEKEINRGRGGRDVKADCEGYGKTDYMRLGGRRGKIIQCTKQGHHASRRKI